MNKQAVLIGVQQHLTLPCHRDEQCVESCALATLKEHQLLRGPAPRGPQEVLAAEHDLRSLWLFRPEGTAGWHQDHGSETPAGALCAKCSLSCDGGCWQTVGEQERLFRLRSRWR